MPLAFPNNGVAILEWCLWSFSYVYYNLFDDAFVWILSFVSLYIDHILKKNIDSKYFIWKYGCDAKYLKPCRPSSYSLLSAKLIKMSKEVKYFSCSFFVFKHFFFHGDSICVLCLLYVFYDKVITICFNWLLVSLNFWKMSYNT